MVRKILIPGTSGRSVEPGKSYVSMNLIEMGMHNGLFRGNRFPMVTSIIEMATDKSEEEAVARVIGPTLAENVKGNERRILIRNQEILPIIKYYGGVFRAQLNLISFPINFDNTRMLFDVVREVGGFINPTISIAASVGGKLYDFVQDFHGGDDTKLVIGIDEGLQDASGIPTGKYLVCMEDVESVEYDDFSNELYVDGNSEINFDYFVFEVRFEEKYPLWYLLPQIYDPYVDYRKALAAARRQSEDLRDALLNLDESVHAAPELTRRNANHIMQIIKEDVEVRFNNGDRLGDHGMFDADNDDLLRKIANSPIDDDDDE